MRGMRAAAHCNELQRAGPVVCQALGCALGRGALTSQRRQASPVGLMICEAMLLSCRGVVCAVAAGTDLKAGCSDQGGLQVISEDPRLAAGQWCAQWRLAPT